MGVLKCASVVVLLSAIVMYVPILELLIEFEEFSSEDLLWKEWTEPKGQFIELSKGKVHYILEGEKDAPLVLVLHGISTSSISMTNISRTLHKSGFRTLRMDFYGRGHSDSPLLVIHNEDLFVNQAVELLQALEAKGEITPDQHKRHHILGWSLGGAVSLVYSSRYPERILSATLIAPPGLPFEIPITGHIALIPHVGELLQHGNLGRYLLESRVPGAFVNPGKFPMYVRALKMLNYFHLKKQGYLAAFLSSLRNFKLHGLQPVYEQVGKEKFPVLFLWGDKDKTVPLHCGQEALKYIPRAELEIYKDSGHVVFIEHQEEVLDRIAKFVSRAQQNTQ